MTFSSHTGKKSNANALLIKRLENIGVQEISLWKEMVLKDEPLFREIYHLIYCDNPRIAWHAAWVIDHVSEADPSKLKMFVPQIIDHLTHLKSSSLKRDFTRMLLSQKIPEDRLGKLVDVLYKLLLPSEAIAVRANSLQLLFNISLIVPELQPELISTTESIMEEELTPGIISKAKNILKLLKGQ